MLEVIVKPSWIKEAKRKAKELGELRNSITKGDGNVAGFLGEMVVQSVKGGVIAGTRDYDIIYDDGTTDDVKTKRCKNKPELHFECSVADFNTKQKCTRYVFVRILEDYSKAWVVGELPKEEYYNRSVFKQKGEKDPSNNWTCLADCYNVAISKLNEVTAA